MSVVSIPLGASIQAAINANPAGTVFQLADGTYYGQQFEPLSNDQFIGAADGGTVLSGAITLTNWTQSGGYWTATGLPAQAVGQQVSGSSPMASDLNDLFINNVRYTAVSSLAQVTAGTWYFDTATNTAYISSNPAGQTAELSVTPSMTYNNGATGVVFQNLTTEMYATDAQSAPIQTGTNWTITNVTSIDNHGAGLYIGGPGTVVQGGSYSDNGQIGIEGSDANNSQVLNAQINGNNWAGWSDGWDAGGLKVTATSGLVVSGDTVSNNNGNGVWADIDSSNWTISNNTIANNAGNGIQYEISHATTNIDGNTITDNVGSGIYISNSDGVNIYGNTVTVNPTNVFNSLGAATGGGITIINNSGRGDNAAGVPYLSINDNVHNNTIIQTNNAADNGFWAYQALPSNANDTFNANTYYVPTSTGTYWYFINTAYTWNALMQSGSFESSGVVHVGLPNTPPTSGTTTPSPNGTRITSTSASPIVDGAGNAWTLVQSASNGLQIAVNGTVQAITANVVMLETLNGSMVCENTSGQWYTEPNPTASWQNIPAPVSTPSTVSPNGTRITATSASPIVDSAGNAWTLVQSASNGLQIAVNGAVQAITANVVMLETLNGNMVCENTSGQWYTEPNPTASWQNIPAPVSPNGTTITTASSNAIVDASANVWTLVQSASNGLQIAANGVVQAITANVVMLETLNGNMVCENTSGQWYTEPNPTASWQNIPGPSVSITNQGSTTLISGATATTTSVDGVTCSLTAPGVATIKLGTLADTLKFIDLSSVTLTGGTGASTITADGGTNSFTGGTGAMTITGGVGADAYTYHAHDGLMTIMDFSLSKGDSLTIDKSLQGAMTQTSDGNGGLILAFGWGNPGVDLAGVTSISSAQIHFA